MISQVRKQTGIRLPESLILQIKKKAKQSGLSFNAYVESVLARDAGTEMPFIDVQGPIDPALLAMAGTIRIPPREELDADPRLASIFGL